jgi:hypothetical protein
VRAKNLPQGLSEKILRLRFIRPITKDGDYSSLTIDDGDFVTDTRDELEQADAESIEDSNQSLLLINGGGCFKVGVHQ